MSAEAPKAAAENKEIEIPEWNDAAVKKDGTSAGAGTTPGRSSKRTLSHRLDAILPPHKRYVGLSRNVFLWVLLAVFLALLVLIIGLAAGLSAHHKYDGSHSVLRRGWARAQIDASLHRRYKNLPLPSNTNSFTGELTYFQTGLGACGETSGQSDDIASISELLFDKAGSSSSTGGNSNNNPLCNKMLRVTRFDEQYGEMRSLDLKVVDRCTGCAIDDIDTSQGAFAKLAPIPSGRVDVTWAWLQPVQTGS